MTDLRIDRQDSPLMTDCLLTGSLSDWLWLTDWLTDYDGLIVWLILTDWYTDWFRLTYFDWLIMTE